MRRKCTRAGSNRTERPPLPPVQAVQYFGRACRAGIAASCYSLGGMYRAMKDEALAGQRLQKACDLSVRATSLPQSGAAPAFCVQSVQRIYGTGCRACLSTEDRSLKGAGWGGRFRLPTNFSHLLTVAARQVAPASGRGKLKHAPPRHTHTSGLFDSFSGSGLGKWRPLAGVGRRKRLPHHGKHIPICWRTSGVTDLATAPVPRVAVRRSCWPHACSRPAPANGSPD